MTGQAELYLATLSGSSEANLQSLYQERVSGALVVRPPNWSIHHLFSRISATTTSSCRISSRSPTRWLSVRKAFLDILINVFDVAMFFLSYLGKTRADLVKEGVSL